MILESSQQFSRFKVLRKIGEGGMGEVYLVEDQKLGRNVALKLLQPEYFDSPDRLERLNREARTAAKVSHSNVMSIYDIGSEKDEKTGRELSFIVMEYIRGESLTDYLRDKNPNLKDLLRVGEKIASGLAAAHKLGIVHRDIKTDNIRIDEEGEPKILDFGLAKPTASSFAGEGSSDTDTVSKELTQEGKILGTITYMSPEQARGETVDSRSDIFSFGTMMYKMFTGVFPFDAPDRVSVLAKILESKQAPVRQLNESLPSELERIIEKCLQKSPNDRYQDTRDLVIDLRSLRKQYESGISDTSSIVTDAAKPSKGRFARRGWIQAGSVVVVLVVLIAAAMSYFSGSNKPTGLQAQENALAIFGFENKTGDSELDWLTSGLPEILLTDLAESRSINLISQSRVLDCLGDAAKSQGGMPSHQACVDAARSLGATRVLSGSVYKLGDMLRIDARLEDLESGKIILGEKVVGQNPIVLVDSLTQKIALSLNISDMMSEKTQVADITSSSPEAYKHYILGMQDFALDFDKAIAEFEKAIEIDSTFALPYMRLGMSYTFQGRNQQAATYYNAASRFASKLPVKERSLLDIYTDIWLRSNFDDALIKTKAYLENYPDDKETRGYYALMLNVLQRDSDAALAQLDTVMMLDPHYYLALSFYATIYQSREDYEKAIEYTVRAKEANPESPTPYNDLSSMYLANARYDEAEEITREMLEKFPESTDAIGRLATLSVLKRDFEMARQYAEKLTEVDPDDIFLRIRYHRILANVAFWTGKFQTGTSELFEAARSAEATGDSTQVRGRYATIASRYLLFEMPDSALFYGKIAAKWASNFSTLNYPMLLIEIDPIYEKEARELMKSAVEEFKKRLPSEMWDITDNFEMIFNARAAADTNALIQGFENMMNQSNQKSTSNLRELGIVLVASGQYQKGKEVLQEILSGVYEATDGFEYLLALYYTGVADEGLGNTADAIAAYKEVLKYWGSPEIEIKEIADTRQRLRKLTGQT